jgi:type II secretory pathway pseudopilin PulG
MGILLPSLGRVWSGNVRTRMTLDMQAISTALDAYKQDHGSYPAVLANNTGAQVLCRALVAPGVASTSTDHFQNKGDGQDGTGFRTRAGGKVYPPYLPADKFKLVKPDGAPGAPAKADIDVTNVALGDRYGKPILYYPANKQANPATNFVAATGYGAGAGKAYFNANDNIDRLNLANLRRLLGDRDANGAINGSESPAFAGAFLLWSAGPDETFGPRDPARAPGPDNRCDDVANFQRGEY